MNAGLEFANSAWSFTSMNRFLTTAFIFACSFRMVCAQAPNVPVYDESNLKKADAAAKKAAVELHTAGALLGFEKVAEQLKERKQCSIKLPAVGKEKLAPRDLWSRARNSHLRVGWLYHDKKKPAWQINLAGGYAITDDGAVATCYHVVEPDTEDMKDGYLIVATDDDKVYPVTEILAASRDTDSCILRVKADKLTMLPISTDVFPGDSVVCFSEPMGRRGYYSSGIVNRFLVSHDSAGKKNAPAAATAATYIEVDTNWAPGSSGAAVLDVFGNAVGHVSTIEAVMDEPEETTKKKKKSQPVGTLIIFHDAVSAKHVKDLVKEK